MSEQHKIELAFSRPRFAVIIATAVVTGLGLLAVGLFAGIEVGSVQARAAIPAAPQTLVESAAPLPLQFAHEIPAIEPADFGVPTADAANTNQQYMVQAASLRGRDQAEKLAADLTQRGYSADVADFTDQMGHGWSIVRVGPYGLRAEASQAASELGHFTRSTPIVRLADN